MNETTRHCPFCTKVLFKEASFKDEADFETVCPHCGKPLTVRVEKTMIITIKPRIEVKLRSQENSRWG